MIICLGWGSLIWAQKTLPVHGNWQVDGPDLPVEFARESRDGRITLVLCEGLPTSTVLWAELKVVSLGEARQQLAHREGVSERNMRHSIGYWSKSDASDQPWTATIGQWASEHSLDGVVWTALKPKLGDDYRIPSLDEVVQHLRNLDSAAQETAREYVQRAPRQIATPYRAAIEATLGWRPTGPV